MEEENLLHKNKKHVTQEVKNSKIKVDIRNNIWRLQREKKEFKLVSTDCQKDI